MATCEWVGNALAVAQVHTWTFAGTWEATDVINVTINGKTISVVAGSTVAATVATTVYTEIAASTIPEFREITWTDDAAVITGTAATAAFRSFVRSRRPKPAAARPMRRRSTARLVYRDGSLRGERPNDVANTANWSGPLSRSTAIRSLFAAASRCFYGLTALASVTQRPFSKIFSSFGRTGRASVCRRSTEPGRALC